MNQNSPSVLGVHAPPPKPTIWAAFLVALALSGMFVGGLGLWLVLFG